MARYVALSFLKSTILMSFNRRVDENLHSALIRTRLTGEARPPRSRASFRLWRKAPSQLVNRLSLGLYINVDYQRKNGGGNCRGRLIYSMGLTSADSFLSVVWQEAEEGLFDFTNATPVVTLYFSIKLHIRNALHTLIQ